MTRPSLVLFAALCVALAAQPSFAGRTRTEVLDRDALLLPYVEQDALFQLTTLRSATGALLLMDQSAATPIRVTPLGISIPPTSTWGQLADGTSNTIFFAGFAAARDRHAYAALATPSGVEVVSLGDLAAPGPLAPQRMASIAAGPGFDPSSTQVGIIAVLIGLLVDPNVPAVSFVEDGRTVTLAWIDGAFRPVRLMEEEGTYYPL